MNTTPEDIKKSAKKLIGIASNGNHILAYAYADGLDVRVVGDRKPEDFWSLALYSSGIIKCQATVLGGRWCAEKLAVGL